MEPPSSTTDSDSSIFPARVGTVKAGMTRAGTSGTRARRRGRARSHNIHRLGLSAKHAGRVRARQQSYLGLLVERVEGERSGREKEGEELVVAHRKAVRRNCAAEAEERVTSWRKSLHGSAIGRLHRRRHRPRKKALRRWRVVRVFVEVEFRDFEAPIHSADAST